MDISAACVAIHMRTDVNNLVTTASTTRLPRQQEAIHIIHMQRKESCSGQIEDLAHVASADCLSDCLTKSSATFDALFRAVSTGVLSNLDMNPPFQILIETQGLYIYISMWLQSILGPQAPFVSLFGDIPLSTTCSACLALQCLIRLWMTAVQNLLQYLLHYRTGNRVKNCDAGTRSNKPGSTTSLQ